ncbi:proline-rich receptor-like protein kinase PERK9 [Eucalyptus grandis]|uniref:proline-rich receptor-like protein kinase PERK9 n=1 Tax=Eucalyptus grandis TaxID=71139 RepID=UPI00192E9BAA|nr:proline-rich receptor-like protein kinase PERK9 [Eucalyptus grandis]
MEEQSPVPCFNIPLRSPILPELRTSIPCARRLRCRRQQPEPVAAPPRPPRLQQPEPVAAPPKSAGRCCDLRLRPCSAGHRLLADLLHLPLPPSVAVAAAAAARPSAGAPVAAPPTALRTNSRATADVQRPPSLPPTPADPEPVHAPPPPPPPPSERRPPARRSEPPPSERRSPGAAPAAALAIPAARCRPSPLAGAPNAGASVAHSCPSPQLAESP